MHSILIVNNTLIFLTIKTQMECGGMCLKEKHHPMGLSENMVRPKSTG